MASETIDSDTIKGVIDFSTALVNLISTLGAVNIALTVFSGYLVSKGIVSKGLENIASKVVTASFKFMGLKTTVDVTAKSIQLLSGAFQMLAVFLATKVIEFAIDKYNEFSNAINTQKQLVEELSGELEGLKSDYQKLLDTPNKTPEQLAKLELLKDEIRLQSQLLEIETERANQKSYRKSSVGTDDNFQVVNEDGKTYTDVEQTISQYETLQEKIKQTSEAISNLTDPTDSRRLTKELHEQESQLVELQATFNDVALSLQKSVDEGFNFNNIYEGMQEDVENFFKFYEQNVKTAIKTTEELEASLSDLPNAFMTVDEIMDSLSKSTDLVSSAYKEMSKSGELTLDTVMQIINAGGELLDVLEVQDGQYKINMDTLEGLFEQDKAIAIERVKNAITQTKAQIDSAKAEIEAQSLVQEASIATLKTNQAVAKANLGVAQSFVKSLGVQSIALGAFGAKLASDSVGAGNASSQATKEAQAKLKDLEAQLKKYEVTLKVLEGTTLPSYSGAVDKTKSSTDKLKDSTDKLNDALKEQEDILDNLVEKYDNTKDAIIEMIDAEIEALEKANDMLGSYDADNSLANKYNIFKDYLLKGLEEEMDGIEKAGEAEKKFWQDKIDALKAEQDANERNKQLEEARLKIQEAQDALAKAELARNQLQKNTRVYKEGVTNSYKYLV